MQAPPGWFPDPSQRALLRAWDGQAWSSWLSDGTTTWQDEPQGPAAAAAVATAPTLTAAPVVDARLDVPVRPEAFAPPGTATTGSVPAAGNAVDLRTPEGHVLARLEPADGLPGLWSVRDGTGHERATLRVTGLGASKAVVLASADGEIGRLELGGWGAPTARVLGPSGHLATVQPGQQRTWPDGRLAFVVLAGPGGPQHEQLAQLAIVPGVSATTWMGRRFPDPLHSLCALTGTALLLARSSDEVPV